jgi:hypothetical protein
MFRMLTRLSFVTTMIASGGAARWCAAEGGAETLAWWHDLTC